MIGELFSIFFSAALASDACPERENVLISDCSGALRVDLAEPKDFNANERLQLAVTGTYSSGDRLGIEGLAVIDGEVLSLRRQGWDGVLIVTPAGEPEIFNARDVRFGFQRYNIKDGEQAQELLSAVSEAGASMIQSHLLISDGVLDLRDVANAPVFYRRLFYVRHDGEFGIWQPKERLSLYDAAVQLQEELQPKMALNLDMGTYNFCLDGRGGDCGRLAISFERLTNILTFSTRREDKS